MGVIGGLWLRWLAFCGRVANLAGYPCLIREGRFESPAVGVNVSVQASDSYTIVTVNGVEVFFHRLSGQFDGVGFSQNSHPRPRLARRLTDSTAPLLDLRAKASR